MMEKTLGNFFVAVVLGFFACNIQAFQVGGPDVGWVIDFGKISEENMSRFDWQKEHFRGEKEKKFTRTYKVPQFEEWKLTGKYVTYHEKSGRAFISIIELLEQSTLEDFKKAQYFGMSGVKGFKEESCKKYPEGIESCDVALYSYNPTKTFYATFYEWSVNNRRFAVVVRNRSPIPDKKVINEAIREVIPLIQKN